MGLRVQQFRIIMPDHSIENQMQMQIPFDTFGGEGRPLHFSHANGYPPQAYRPLLTALSERYRVTAMHARPLWQPEPAKGELPDWSWMVCDLFSFFETHGLQNIIGMGHSMGAVATLLAALERPEQFRGLILLDPTLLPQLTAIGFGLIKKLGLVYRLPLLKTAVRRRSVFTDRRAMFSYYRRKNVFRRIVDEDLRTIVKAQARERADGQIELRYSSAWEAHVYATSPYRWWPLIKGMKTPVLIIAGKETDIFPAASIRTFQRRVPRARIEVLENAGHLVPFERTECVTELITDFVNSLD